MRYRAIVFDLFRTLIAVEAVNAGGPNVRELVGILPERWDPAWLRYEDGRVRGRYRRNAEVLAHLASEMGLDWSPERCAEIAAWRAARFRRAVVQVDAAALAVLSELRARGLRLGLMSDADCEEVAAWPESPLAPLFDAALFSCHEGLRKPEAAFYQRACERLAVEPADCLYVGDGGSDEHRGARAVGMTPVLLTRFLELYWPQQIAERVPLCDHVVSDLRDVIELVQG